MKNVAVFVSGGGTNLQVLLDAWERGEIPDGHPALVLSSRAEAYALKRAESRGVPTVVVPRKDYADREAYTDALCRETEKHGIDVIVLAGFLSIFGEKLIRRYPNRIINVHPSLIPSFCGEGFYGLHVHEAALARGVKVTGATVHLVNEVCDGGPILLQKAVEVFHGDTPQTLQRRVMEQAEWVLLPRALQMLCGDKIVMKDGIAVVEE